MKAPTLRCKNCDLFEREGQKSLRRGEINNYGKCHRYPPGKGQYDDDVYIVDFPIYSYTDEDNWCVEMRIDGVKYFD